MLQLFWSIFHHNKMMFKNKIACYSFSHLKSTYSGDPNTELVRYSNGRTAFGYVMVRFWNGIPKPDQNVPFLNGLVFEWFGFRMVGTIAIVVIEVYSSPRHLKTVPFKIWPPKTSSLWLCPGFLMSSIWTSIVGINMW